MLGGCKGCLASGVLGVFPGKLGRKGAVGVVGCERLIRTRGTESGVSGWLNSSARDALAASASAENGCKGEGMLLPVDRKDILDLKEEDSNILSGSDPSLAKGV